MLEQTPRQEWEQGVLRNSNLASAAPGTQQDALWDPWWARDELCSLSRTKLSFLHYSSSFILSGFLRCPFFVSFRESLFQLPVWWSYSTSEWSKNNRVHTPLCMYRHCRQSQKSVWLIYLFKGYWLSPSLHEPEGGIWLLACKFASLVSSLPRSTAVNPFLYIFIRRHKNSCPPGYILQSNTHAHT